MIWFNGDIANPDWMIGMNADLNEKKYSAEYMQSNDDTNCPESSQEWTELHIGLLNSEWAINEEAFVRPYSPALGCYRLI